jgi:hypothetical protein
MLGTARTVRARFAGAGFVEPVLGAGTDTAALHGIGPAPPTAITPEEFLQWQVIRCDVTRLVGAGG